MQRQKLLEMLMLKSLQVHESQELCVFVKVHSGGKKFPVRIHLQQERSGF